VRIFAVDISLFERKRYASLSHEANKAMNLNSYISLMGGSWDIAQTPRGDVLLPASKLLADLDVPDPDYVLTLDADSLLVRDYCLRLVHLMEQPGNERVAVAQTPYSSYRGAPSRLERVAGATTDLQHLQHLGRTHFGATFWVGANAVIRKGALEDIVEVDTQNGYEVRRYIQDRTVIEDTESSIDLRAEGWDLVNYPERLSFSATPPDFGSLVVQRRRWANGGLVILPKVAGLVRACRRRGERVRAAEVALRMDYLGSIAWTTVGVLVLLAIPMVGTLISPLLLLTALPYYLATAADLRFAGHRRVDALWVFALNLVLLPVNLAGVLKSLEQAVTGRKIPFARTPKVADRVAAPALFVTLPFVMVIGFAVLAWVHATQHAWTALAFDVVTGAAVLVGAIAFVGVRGAAHDVRTAVSAAERSWRRQHG
jgi:cellulose synthase/poly-beta-1,6-N-acetylglucosamine synthase-like glycosyltransferase